MKPTEEQIRAEAERRFVSRKNQVIFEEGAKFTLSQDSTIEKVKELRDHYERVTLDWVPRENFIVHLNSIIEAK